MSAEFSLTKDVRTITLTGRGINVDYVELIFVRPDLVEDCGAIPQKYSLEQNYPNPFNPTTNISFSLPSRALVTLKIFDIIGREVAVVVKEELSAGNHTRQWNATNSASGIYFYRLQAGKYVATKKLVLLR
jgi:hypothetical protein